MKEFNQIKFKQHGARITQADTAKVAMRMPLRGLLGLLNDSEVLGKMNENNQRIFSHYASGNHDPDWFGGTREDLNKGLKSGIELTPHRKALKEIERGDIGRRLVASFDTMKAKRKFKCSDNDGDFIWSRRFDDKPFIDCKKESRPTKTIEVVVNLCFSAAVSKKEIDSFGAFVWALINLIESRGVQARLIIANHGLRAGQSIKNLILETVIKDTDQYLSPGQMAACISTLFMRRAVFGWKCIAVDSLDQQITMGLSTPQHYSKPIEYKDGQLIISGHSQKGNTDLVLTEIRKALTCRH